MKPQRLILVMICMALRSVVLNGQPALTETEKTELVRAVEDETYDYNLQHDFRSIGKALAGEKYEIPLYVTTDSHGASYYVIYRLMPFGEMYRLITLRPDGLAMLFRNPRSGFPPDAPAMQTEYYDDDTICRNKHDATKVFFVVDMNPSALRIKEAIERQKMRYGFSNLQDKMKKERLSHKSTP